MMSDQPDMAQLKARLIERRNEIFERRHQHRDTWERLHEAENEFEETAQKAHMSQGLAQLDASEKNEIEAIDRALGRMETGDYGYCDGCGDRISPKRLEALPFVPFCTRCAERLEKGRPLPRSEEEGEAAYMPPDYAGMTDDQLADAVSDELEKDGRVELDELDVSCDDGVIHLTGALPSESKREILHEIVEDVMGLPEVVDQIRIDPTLWQRGEEVAPASGKRSKAEILMEGEESGEEGEDVYAAERDGEPLRPPDKMVPER
jgi:RNA polymerase-binding transcription factor DksA